MSTLAYKIGYNQTVSSNYNGGLNSFYIKGIKKTKRFLGGVSLNILVLVMIMVAGIGPYIALRCSAVSLDSNIRNLKQSLKGLTEQNNTLETTVSKDFSPVQITAWAKINNFIEVKDFIPLVLNSANNVALTK